jgi:hypothetical protein
MPYVQLAFDSAEDLHWTIAFDVCRRSTCPSRYKVVPGFVVGSDLAQAWSCGCTALPMTSAAPLSFSGALLFMVFNMSTSVFAGMHRRNSRRRDRARADAEPLTHRAWEVSQVTTPFDGKGSVQTIIPLGSGNGLSG